MNILITGGAGFIGSAVSEKLLYDGHNIIVVDNLSTGSEENIHDKAELIKIDICSPKLEEIFIKNKIDAVYHFAAQTGVIKSAGNPLADAQNNILGSINLFSLCKKYNIKKTIIHSSAAVYGTPQYLPVDEKHPLQPLSFYGLSKMIMEKYAELFGINYVILRPSNVYSLNQPFSPEAGVITKFFTKMKNNEQVTIFGNGSQTRDFIHVDDIAQICKLSLNLPDKKYIMNASSSKETSVAQIFEIISGNLNYTQKPLYLPENICEIKKSILDNSLMKKTLCFTPQKNLNDIIVSQV